MTGGADVDVFSVPGHVVPERRCSCGQKLAVMNKGSLCFRCQGNQQKIAASVAVDSATDELATRTRQTANLPGAKKLIGWSTRKCPLCGELASRKHGPEGQSGLCGRHFQLSQSKVTSLTAATEHEWKLDLLWASLTELEKDAVIATQTALFQDG